jgi:UDP-N-acetylglucosamine 2-epimerase (non-hydrolysing)
MRTAVILGTRPEIIKMSPVIRELQKRKISFFIIHTGQHYSYNLDKVFVEQLKLPQAAYNLEVGSSSHAEQTGKILTGVEDALQRESPDLVLVEGDTNSTLAAALAAVKVHIRVGHIEAGLRSYDRNMPEEINRILVDHCSEYLFIPTAKSGAILRGEGIPEDRIYVTGNTIVDAINQNLEISKKQASIIDKLGVKYKGYILVTIHRQENVDYRARFASILEGVIKTADECDMPVVYPVHPRARKMMTEFRLRPRSRRIILTEPVDFLEFLQLESNARLILTDSGGVQEEACILRVPCVTLRDNTERPETIDVGANVLAGTLPGKIVEGAGGMLKREINWQNPFGDGKAAVRIIDVIDKKA